jgi:hypothetical protein
LQHAQHLGLRGQGHVADFVEKDRAAVRLLELAGAIGDSSGERTLHVSEQLALDQFRRNRGTVDLHERPFGTRGIAMYGPGNELFARSIFPGYQHASGRSRHLFDLVRHRAYRVRLSDDLESRLDRLAEPRVFLVQVEMRERVPQSDENPIGVQRLLEDVVRAPLRRFHSGLDCRMPADHDDDRGRVDFAQPFQSFEAVDPGHLHVEENQMWPEALVLGDAVGRVVRRANLVALELEQLSERLADSCLVIDDQDFSRHWGWRVVGRGLPCTS